MKISAKGRYGLAAMAYLARNFESGTPVTIISISEKLGISKIYLEQVFSLLMRPPGNITAFDVLSAIELGLMEKAGTASPDKMPELDRALAAKVFDPLDESIRNALMAASLEDILNAMDQEAESLMYFI